MDLPGYGYAKRSKAELAQWGQLMEDYLLGRPTLAAVVLLVDARRGLELEDRDLLTLLGGPARVTRRPLGSVLAATKLDKIATSAQAGREFRAASTGTSDQAITRKTPRSHGVCGRFARQRVTPTPQRERQGTKRGIRGPEPLGQSP